ncbi:MAG: SOS response-associated peptidase family protein [Atopobiaceae bacterium]|nr:SOS response-associated peptidase family protein [Atopobiaceae bacterium]
MCHRVTPLTLPDLEEALDNLKTTGRARMPRHGAAEEAPDAYPGTQLPLFVPNKQGELEACMLTWGFKQPGGPSKLVFNTRIETALSQARSGRGLWHGPILNGRCLVPVRRFYESWTREPPRRGAQVAFSLPRHAVFLLAGVYEDERFSIVTTTPNADVAPIHSRMPLVLAPGESRVWLGPDFARLANRDAIELAALPKDA